MPLVNDLLTHIRYILYGFGINSALVLALGGWVVHHLAKRLKNISELHEQFEVFKQRIEDIIDRESGRQSLSNGLVKIESSQKLDHQDLEMMKRWLRDLDERCDRTHRTKQQGVNE